MEMFNNAARGSTASAMTYHFLIFCFVFFFNVVAFSTIMWMFLSPIAIFIFHCETESHLSKNENKMLVTQGLA